ncbi:MAG: histidine--tRNA ligase [Oscillospiraceae bacterium]|nr:histidine--tRNA ligase [Oscillospiraceae bacterium]
MALLKRPNGTRDTLPSETSEWQALEGFLCETAHINGFHEIRIPTFEHTDLFARGVGETTDVVQKEMYTFEIGKHSYTLRPEGTAGVVRAVLENGLLNEALPLKLFYILSCFRHEAVQHGRQREFHQFGVEMAGSSSPAADAEVIGLANQILTEAGVGNASLRINSIGCPTCRKQYSEALRNYFAPHTAELCATCHDRMERNPMRLLDCKEAKCKVIAKDAPSILEYLCDDCKAHFAQLKHNLELLNISYTVDSRIVRGLDYYTKTVFEFIVPDGDGELTVCGGGRYDGLVEELGGNPTPALGFGMGLERLLATLHDQGITLSEPDPCCLYIVPMGEKAADMAMKLTNQLRKEGSAAQTDVMGRSLRAQMKYADRIGARFTMVIGDNELENGEAVLKNMKTGEKITMKLGDDFVDRFCDIEIADRLAAEE